MKKTFLGFLIFLFASSTVIAQNNVVVQESSDGLRLLVDGEPFMINGMNWDYFPIGTTNPSYNFWGQSDDFIKAALDHEMSLLKNMGVNVIRQYVGVTPRWVEYIYEKYGIYTMINHTFGRYGLTIDGAYVAITDYADPKTREILISEAVAMAEQFKGTKGLLLYMLGNENNYGLFWDGAETEDVPMEDRRSTKRAVPMYKVFNDATLAMKEVDTEVPIALCNGDLLFMDIIAEQCPDVDIFGTNVYRGVSFGDLFQRVKDEYGKPVLFAEFGSDAFNAVTNEEAQMDQAYYNIENWKEIYEQAAGLGKVGNSIGGFTFQFSDGWWKYAQTKNLDVHDNVASWENGGYRFDHVEGENNMNEEWFGICAKGPTNAKGLYKLYPRAAYYAMKEAHQLNPYEDGMTLEFIDNYFNNIELADAMLRARGDKAALSGGASSKLKISQLRAEFTTFNTGGSLITTPDSEDPDANTFPDQLGFDHMQSYFVGVEGNPAPNMRANVNFNILGRVAENPIDEIFYENRGRPVTVETDEGPVTLNDNNRVAIYNADFEWKAREFDLRGFYRTGHYHWGYEGDFFGLYPEANYGPNLDIYNGEILGVEIDGKKFLDGLKVAFGPQLWWGANPGILVKYRRQFGKFDIAGIYHEDVDELDGVVTSGAIPMPRTRRATLYVKTKLGNLGVELGGIWGGQPLNGRTFQIVDGGTSGNYNILEDEITSSDNWGGKIKLTYQKGRFNWYASSAIQGLVANGGFDQTRTFTGWRLKDTGSGNQVNFLTGFTYLVGDLQIAPNFMYQKPLVDPMPNDVQAPGRLRNIFDDPFSVRSNRETTGFELLLTYDPTPGTWMYEWDNDRQEDAKFAMSTGFTFRHLPTAQDAAIGFLANRTLFAFPGSAPAQDLWESNTRIVSKLSPDFGIIGNIYFGNGQANGDSDRTIERYGGDIRLIYKKLKVTHGFKLNDWGPFDYHRDFNLTFPVQLMLDISTNLGKPDWFILPDTRIGIRGTWRSLDEFSNRYAPNAAEEFADEPIISPVGFDNGSEWEIRTYVHINIGK